MNSLIRGVVAQGEPPSSPLVMTHLASGQDGSDATSYDTASVSPDADRLLVLIITPADGNTPVVDTVTGLGLTWTQVHSEEWTTNYDSELIAVYVAKTGGSAPTPGTITVTSTASEWNSFGYALYEVENADISGAAADAIVQHPSATGTSGDPSLTMAAFASSGNGVIAACATLDCNTDVLSVDANHTEGGHDSRCSPPLALITGFAETEDASFTYDINTANGPLAYHWVLLGLEVAQA